MSEGRGRQILRSIGVEPSRGPAGGRYASGNCDGRGLCLWATTRHERDYLGLQFWPEAYSRLDELTHELVAAGFEYYHAGKGPDDLRNRMAMKKTIEYAHDVGSSSRPPAVTRVRLVHLASERLIQLGR